MKQSMQSLIDLIGVSDEDCLVLKTAAPQTGLWADEYVKMFYETLFAYAPTQALFHEGERQQREKTIRDWYCQVVNGEIGEQFWQQQHQVGQKHVGRGIMNSYMVGMMHRTQQFFLEKCVAAFGTEEAVKVYSAFKRVTDMACGIIAEGYHTPYAVMKVGT
jgi:hypothetical protein